MARTLNGTALPTNTDWVDRFQHVPVRQTKRRTTGGGLVVSGQSLIAGRPVTLEWARGRQWLTYANVQTLQALVDSGPEAVFSFVWDELVYTVQIDFERGGLQLEQRGWRLNPSNDKFYGTLALFTR
jgi:hypothetical protein